MAMELKIWLNEVLRKHVHDRESKVCVVSVIGKSPFCGYWNKINPINDIVGRQVFENVACVGRKVLDSGSEIEAYFSSTLQTVFLHLVCPYDSSLQEQVHPDDNEDFHSWWTKREEIHAAHLLALFLTSHIVMLMHPTCRFDTSYFRLFRTLENMRDHTLSAVCGILAETNSVPKGWSLNGRLCAPRLLFGFHRPPSFMKADGTVETKQGSYRKVERSMEDQVYTLFRKSRLITNNSTNALVTLPANQSFVYVFPPTEEPRDFIQDLLNSFRVVTGAKDPSESTDDSVSAYGGFKEFLMEHISLALSDGFNDNVGKTGPASFELPKLKSFVRGLSAVYDYLVTNYNENIELEELPDLLDVTTRFSDGRCKKILPVALNTYMDGLPQYYPSTYHKAKLAQAFQVLKQQARGPSLERTQIQLVEDCERHWFNGHQACEVLSLTGNHCANPVHRASDTLLSSSNADNELPLLNHNSKIRFLSTCNCGRRQSWREDPFSLREANYDFYEWRDEFECCRRRTLDRIEYPIYVAPSRRRTISDDGERKDFGEESNEGMEKHEDTDSAPADKDAGVQGRRLEAKTTENMFDRLKIATQSQEARNDNQEPSAGEDLLPDRDNKPATGGCQLGGDKSLGDIESFSSGPGYNDNDGHGSAAETTKIPEATSEHGRHEAKSAGDSSDIEGPRIRRPSSRRSGGGTAVFEDLINSDNSAAESGSNESQDHEVPDVVGADYENESPAVEMDGSEKEEDQRLRRTDSGEERSSSRSELADEYEKENWGQVRKTSTHSEKAEDESDQPLEEGAREDVDYLSGMVHSACPPGLLPLFSSWSLVCIGSSRLYSHSHGLREQPNFSHGSNFLLPWDVELQVNVERWQEQMESIAASSLKRIGPFKKPRQPKQGSNGAVTVKIFIGFEYECPRGHRFMLQTPDRVLKHPSNSVGGPKENGGLLLKNDMPLWFPCSCRQAKAGFPGQLMRIHIVTPKAPVIVTVNPRVQPRLPIPGKPSIAFHPGAPGPAKLDPAQYWVLRLPFVYLGPDGPCYPPRESSDNFGRVLRGMINVFPDLEH